ncbi:MAG: YIP1 family protein [Bacillota bacterium]
MDEEHPQKPAQLSVDPDQSSAPLPVAAGLVENNPGAAPGNDQIEVGASSSIEINNSYLETLYGMFFTPSSTLGYVIRKKPYLWAVLTMLGVTLFTSLMSLAASLPIDGQLASEFGEFSPYLAQFSTNLGYVVAIIAIISVPVCWFFLSAVLHLLAEFFSEQGDGKGLFVALGFANLPLVLGSVFSFLARAVGLGGSVGFILQFAALVWVIVLHIIAMRVNYELNVGQAMVILFLPLVTLILWVILVGLAFGSAFIPWS